MNCTFVPTNNCAVCLKVFSTWTANLFTHLTKNATVDFPKGLHI